MAKKKNKSNGVSERNQKQSTLNENHNEKNGNKVEVTNKLIELFSFC